jgi:hypothetical protein
MLVSSQLRIVAICASPCLIRREAWFMLACKHRFGDYFGLVWCVIGVNHHVRADDYPRQTGQQHKRLVVLATCCGVFEPANVHRGQCIGSITFQVVRSKKPVTDVGVMRLQIRRSTAASYFVYL